MSFVLRACFALLCAVTFPLAWAAVELIDSDPPARAEDVGVQASFELHLRELPAGAEGIAMALFLGPRGAEGGRIAASSAGRLRVTPHRPLLPGADYTLLVAPRGGGAPPWAAVAFRTRALPAPAPAEESAPPDAGSEGEFFRPGPEQRRGLWLSGAVHAHSRDAQQQARELSSILARVPSESARSALRTSLLRAGHPGASALSQLSPTAPADAARGTAKPSAQAASAAGASLAGQVHRLDGRPLPGVAVSMGGRSAQTDAEGEFMLTGLAPGAQVLVIDGRRAGERRADHGRYEYALELRAGANELPHTVWLTRIDRRHAVRLPSPTIEEAVVTHPDMPGFELRIPPGTVIRDAEGQIVREVSVTPIPVDQKPFPFPYAGVPLYYTIQPGGARLESVDGQPRGATLHYPNYSTQPAGALVELFDYDPQGRGWYVYAKGRVSADGTTIDPARPFTLYQFGMSSVSFPPPPPPPPPGPPPPPCPGCFPLPPPGPKPPCDASGDPVFCATGQFLEFGTDLFVADVSPLSLRREHASGSPAFQSQFGIGGRSPLDLYLSFRETVYPYATAVDLTMPAGGYVRFTPPGGGQASTADPAAIFRSNEPGAFFGATATGLEVRATDGTRYSFASAAKYLAGIEDRWGNLTSLLRDATYRVTRVISPSGRWIEFTYGVAGCTPCIATATDHTGRRVQYSYDALGRLEHVTDPTGERVSYTYDSEHRMLTVTDARRNRKVLNEYHTGTGNTLLDGRVRHQTYADGSTHGFGYSFGEGPDGVVRITRSEVTDARGFVRRRVYDSRQRITADTLALGQPEQATTTYGYDSAGLMTAQTDPLLRRTAYSYDTAGNLTSRTVLDGTAQQAAWATAHEPQCNQPRLSTDPLSRKITATYTGCVLDQVADDLGHRVRYQWNPNGTLRRLIREPSPGVSLATHYEYNESGDLVRITDPLERSTRLEVDALGRTTAVVDPAGNRATFAYDAKDRLVQRCNALVQCATYGYDANDNLTSFVMGTTRRQWTYDAMNRLIAEQRDGVTLLTWSYDGTGLLRTVTDASGRQLEHVSHDALGRVKQSRLSQGGTVRRTVDYGYDLAGRLLALADSAAGTLSYTHDDRFDAIASETTPAGSVQYAYFANGLRQAMTASGASTVSYEYDAANRLVGIGQAAGAGPAQPLSAQAVSFGYDGANRRTALNLPNGIVVASAWDEADQIQRLSYRRGGAALGELAYGHDAAGRRVKVEGSFARTLLPGAASLATGEDGRVASDNGAAATYDAMGRLTQDSQYRYVWDEAGQLIEVRNAGNNALRASFSYDAAGRRGSKSIDGQVTRYLHDGINPIQLQDGSGTPQENLLAAGVDQWLLRTRAGQTQYFLADALGSTVRLTDAAGAKVVDYTYEPYGAGTNDNASAANAFQYTGRENDGLGLYYYRARYLKPRWGRFISPDPIGVAGGDSVYAYVGGNPVSQIDPLGLFGVADLPTVPPSVVDAVTGFGDAFLIPELIRDALDIDGGVNQCSAAYRGGKATGFVVGSAPFVLRGAAALGGTRLGHALNHNRYLRMGPGRMPANSAGMPAGTGVPRMSLGPQIKGGPPNPHADLRSRFPYAPPFGGPAECGCP